MSGAGAQICLRRWAQPSKQLRISISLE
jgi:hypothetical protein